MPPMAAEDGGFLWLLGNILSAVDEGFHSSSWMGVQSQDSTERRTTISHRNDKNERQNIGVVETNYNHWREDVGRRNQQDLRELNDPHQGRQRWWHS